MICDFQAFVLAPCAKVPLRQLSADICSIINTQTCCIRGIQGVALIFENQVKKDWYQSHVCMLIKRPHPGCGQPILGPDTT